MLIKVTNARTGKAAFISPNIIGQLSERDDPKYPNTNSVLVLNDTRETFIPCVETVDQIAHMMAGAVAASPRRSAPIIDPEDPGASE
jgi:hypothetical protein